MKFLFIDDDENFLEHVKSVAGSFHLDFDTASTLTEGRMMMDSTPYDHVFIDVFMKDGNGVDFAYENNYYPGELHIMTGDFNKDGCADKFNGRAMSLSLVSKEVFTNFLHSLSSYASKR